MLIEKVISLKKKILMRICAVICLLGMTSCVQLRDGENSEDRLESESERTYTVSFSENDSFAPSEHNAFASSAQLVNDHAAPAETDEISPAIEVVDEKLGDPYLGVEIKFLAAGDNLIHPNIYMDASFRGTEEKTYDFLPMYENIAEAVASADYAFINQETVMAGAGYENSGYPTFNSPQQLGQDLVEVGFDIIGMANNHMLDKGAGGLSSTMDFWDTQPVVTVGSFRDEEDYARLRIIEEDGVKIALLSYTYGTNGIVKPASSPLVIPYIEDGLIVSDIGRAEEEADFTIVSIHWGDENTQIPNNEQKRLAQLIADSGADLILGHHSHTIQPIETITSADGRKVICTYSLGNLVSGMARPVNQVGGLFTFTVRGDGMGGLTVDDVLFTPTVFYYGMDWYDTKLYYLEDYTAEIASTHGVQISGYTLTPEQARSFVTGTIDAEFLPDWMK